jgi:hypothetical protein
MAVSKERMVETPFWARPSLLSVEALVVPITQVAVAPHQVDQEVALVLV